MISYISRFSRNPLYSILYCGCLRFDDLLCKRHFLTLATFITIDTDNFIPSRWFRVRRGLEERIIAVSVSGRRDDDTTIEV